MYVGGLAGGAFSIPLNAKYWHLNKLRTDLACKGPVHAHHSIRYINTDRIGFLNAKISGISKRNKVTF